MKKRLLLLPTILLFISTSYGQTNNLFIGPALSFHNETRRDMIYGPGYEEKNSFTQFLGTGLRLQKKFKKSWGLTLGLTYVKRQYRMMLPFNHCYFLPPGQGCPLILAHLDRYGYKTLELPVGINQYLLSKNKLELYLSLTALTAFSFQAVYNSQVPFIGTKRMNAIHYFSTSLTSSLGVGYRLSENVKLIIEPFVRLMHRQRKDSILFVAYEDRLTHFDNFGAHLYFMFRL
jgi:hypothetical protein